MEFTPKKLYSALFINSIYTIYNIEFPGDYIFKGESHDFWELGYIIAGQAGITSDDNIFCLEEGELFIQKPNLFHTSWAINNSKYRMFIITFNGEGLKYSMPGGKFRLNEKERSLLEMLIAEVPNVYSRYDIDERQNLTEIADPSDEGYQIIKNYVELICLSLKRREREAAGAPADHEMSVKFSKAVKFLKENIQKNLSIYEISRHLAESPSSLKKIFRLFTGGGIIRYYNHIRCQYSIQLLGDGYKIQEISDMMNFSSRNYFSFFFKREIGVSPNEYMKK